MHVLVGGLRVLTLLYRWFQTELARDMGYAAARFGHVMFPENVYEPALECAELLLENVGKGWPSRAYFSDNGSTAIEIALKMAFRELLTKTLNTQTECKEKSHVCTSGTSLCALDGTELGKTWERALPEYRQGIKDFLDFAFEHTTMGNKIFCPCKQCNNYFAKTRDDVEADLLTIGILPNCTQWFRHGEDRHFETCDSLDSDDESDGDGLSEMIEDYYVFPLDY